jgi:uroporphyrinogen decarboxylase
MSVYLEPHHISTAEKLVEETRTNGGLAPVDLDQFWADDEKASKDPFSPDCPQPKLGLAGMSKECLFAELGIEENWYPLLHDDQYVCDLSKRYNDIAEKIVGRRLLNEVPGDPERVWPKTKLLHDIFEAKNVWHSESYWILQSAENPRELSKLLDRVEKRLENLREFLLPENWEAEKTRLEALGEEVPVYRGQRGPVTFATSVYGPENLIYLIHDDKPLAARFRDLILQSILGIARVLDEEAGKTPETSRRGFGWADDNCALLNEEMYMFFGYPILEAVFKQYSPCPDDPRAQHSDSDMAHLLPVLSSLNFSRLNLGPTVKAGDIRKHHPGAIIQGQLAPFTFSRNEEVNIVAEFLRDFEMTRNTRGLSFTTAGSINNGSRLTGMRLIMAAIQRYGRYG